MTPRTSAIVIFRDAQAFLADAIESVRAQTTADWELILVDDGSTDGGAAIASAAAAHDARIRLVEFPGRVNRGMSAARNLGLDHARGETVAFLDADDRWPASKLEKALALLEAHPRAAVAFGRVALFPEAVVLPGPARVEVIESGELLRRTLLARPALLTTLGNPVIRRRALEAVGGSEEEFRGQAEDAVVWCKLALANEFVCCPDVTLEYRRHPAASGAVDARRGTLAAGQAFFAQWLLRYVSTLGEDAEWARPIVDEFLFRSLVLEAWAMPRRAIVQRRIRLVRTVPSLAREGVLTRRRAARVAAQFAFGLRSGALSRMQEPASRVRVARAEG